MKLRIFPDNSRPQDIIGRLSAKSPRATRILRNNEAPSSLKIASVISLCAVITGVIYSDSQSPSQSIYITDKQQSRPNVISSNLNSHDKVVPNYPVDTKFSIDKEHFVLISKDSKRLMLYKKVCTYKVATGKNSGNKQRIGDCRTPETPHGSLYPIKSKLHTPALSQFGPCFIGLSTPPWNGIAIHGTDVPDTIGTNASHGCVRLSNSDIRPLFSSVDIGDPVLITK